MRLIIFLGVLAVIGLVVTGAIKLQKAPDANTISIQIDKQAVCADAERVVEEGRHVLQEAEAAVQQDSVQK